MDAHRRRAAASAEDETTVVGDVQPLVCVGGPESACSIPSVRYRKAGLVAAYIPNAPSTWTQAPNSRAAAQMARRGSTAPVFTLSACAHTMVGPEDSARASSSASARILPWTVGWDRPQVGGPETKEAQSAVYGDVALLTDDNPDRRRADQSVGLYVPTGASSTLWRGGERGEVRHLAAGHQPV